MKYLFISSDLFPPFRVDVKVLFGKELVARGHHIDWLLQSESGASTSYEARWEGGNAWVGATDLGTSRWRRFKRHLLGFFNDLKLFPLIKRNNYDFVQVKDKFVAALMAIIATKLYRVKFIYWLSYPFPEASLYQANEKTARYPILYRVRGWTFSFLLYKVIIPAADHVFVQSDQMKRDIEAHGIDSSLMTPVPMGIDLPSVELGLAPPPFASENETRLVYLGTLIKIRRIDFLVRVLGIVRDQYPDAVLYLVGSGDDKSDEEIVREQAKALGIDEQVHITGFLPMRDAWAYVQSADVCLSPFYPTPILNSTSPTKLIEYMSMCKAVVANDHPEQRLVLQESDAGLCVPYDERAFAQAVCELLGNPDMRAEMGRRGRQYVNMYRSYSAISEQVDAKYREIVGRGDDAGRL